MSDIHSRNRQRIVNRNLQRNRQSVNYEPLETRQLLAADFQLAAWSPLNPIAYSAGRTVEPIATDLLSANPSNYQATVDLAAANKRFEVSRSTDGQWVGLDHAAVKQQTGRRMIHLNQFRTFDLQESVLAATLKNAPLEFTPNFESRAVTVTIPRPDGSFARFAAVEAPIMEPGLAEEFPDIKTYRGIGIDDPAASLRFDLTMFGFHAQVLTPNGSYYVDPVFHGKTDLYSSYFRTDVINQNVGTTELVVDGDHEYPETDHALTAELGGVAGVLGTAENSPSEADPFGTQLRTFRLANAATIEYTNYFGGTVSNGQAAIVTAINRVTGVYEKDLAIRLVLVNNNSSLVYTNLTGDPYTNSNGVTMLGQNQTNIDAVIGNVNYDIGHVFSTGGGGVAGFGVVGVTNQKARGVTGQNIPTGDPFFIDYVAHEMGHQFGGSHTFNSSTGACGGNRSSNAAFEPGSGSTIMGYAGICGSDDLQSNSDAMFHSFSIDQIRAYIATIGSVGTTNGTGNAVPTVNAGSNYVIPANTPFELTAVGSDANSGNVLTYSWEQRDRGSSTSLSSGDNGSSPLFRTWNPTTSPTRVFPRLSNLLNNTVPLGERLPTVNWPSTAPMDFRVVVRDNALNGGGVSSDDMSVQVVNTGAAFLVTSQNSSTNWAGLSSQTITWSVANTTLSPISAANVDIWFSSDGGLTFPTLLVGATPNDGSQSITVPNVETGQGRIKVKATGNIFFDINNVNFNVLPAPTVNLSGPTGLIPEGDVGSSTANFVLTLTTAPTAPVSVNYTTTITGSNSATAGSDFDAVSGTAMFGIGQTTVSIPVTIFGDRFTEGIEQFGFALTSPVGLELGASSVTVSISDDDSFALGRTIDFGSLTTPVEPNATGFSTGSYSAAVGIGWTSAADLIPYSLTVGSDVTRDMILNTQGQFRIDVPNGNYLVEAIIGIVNFNLDRANYPASFANFSLIVEGTSHALNLTPGNLVTQTFSAAVTDGQLDVGMNSVFARQRARLSGLRVMAAGNRGLDSVISLNQQITNHPPLTVVPFAAQEIAAITNRVDTVNRIERAAAHSLSLALLTTIEPILVVDPPINEVEKREFSMPEFRHRDQLFANLELISTEWLASFPV